MNQTNYVQIEGKVFQLRKYITKNNKKLLHMQIGNRNSYESLGGEWRDKDITVDIILAGGIKNWAIGCGLKIGDLVLVEGSLESYTDQNKVSRCRVAAREIKFLDFRYHSLKRVTYFDQCKAGDYNLPDDNEPPLPPGEGEWHKEDYPQGGVPS